MSVQWTRVDGVKTCDHCVLGDHGQCYRVVCKCTHPNFTRDPNAQVPHGQAAGWSKEVKHYE